MMPELISSAIRTSDDEDYEEISPDEIVLKDREEKLGFRPQREIIWNRHLPYADSLDEESQKILNDIKFNLGKALAMRDINPGVGIYSSKLMKYIKLYGYKFSKEDHIKFVKYFIELIALADLEPAILNKFCCVLLLLLRKGNGLEANDFEIEWRPFHKLFMIYLHKTSTKGNFYQFFSVLQDHLRCVIKLASVFFPKAATREILDEVLPKLLPLDTGKSCQTFEIFYLFLNYREGYEFWFDDFMNLWNTYYTPTWSDYMMEIMGCLAFENIGKIDWEPHLPVMFARILRWIDLPVSYKNLKAAKNPNFSVKAVAKWIVAVLGPKTAGQEYLSKFIGATESYLHPANSGKWIKNIGQLLVQLPEFLFKRLECERFRKTNSWLRPVPDSYKLTEDCITKFVECLKPAAFQSMYSRIDSNDVHKIFRHLSNLRPELIIPGVIERVYANLESLTEPHRLTASLQCLVGISRSLICGHNGYTVGRTHVVPILLAVLPGIDPNDLRKALLTLNFYGAFVFQIPIIDCSKAGQYYNDLTEEEELICEQTADFEDFVLQFIDRLFLMIKFSTQESIRMEQSNTDSHKSRYDMIVENSLSNGLQIILNQCSEEILSSAAKKVTDFVRSNLLEPHVAGPLLGTLVNAVAQIAGDNVYKTLVPYLTDRLKNFMHDHEDAAEMEKQSDDFLYYFTMLNYIFKSNPVKCIEYLDHLLPIIDETILFKCKLTAKLISMTIFTIIYNISRYQMINLKNFSGEGKTLKDFLPIRHWGRKMSPDETLDWYIPGDEALRACEKIHHRYLPAVLEKFENHIDDKETMCREDILKYLNLVISLIGMTSFLPNWKEEPKKIIETVVNNHPYEINLGFNGRSIRMPDGSDVRLAVIKTIGRLQDKILATSDDDIKSLKSIVQIWERVHMRKSHLSTYESEVRAYKHLKQFYEYKLVEKMRNMKMVIAKRVLIQQCCRDEHARPAFTESHREIMLKLLKLSTSHYSGVRCLAQMKLFSMINSYAFCYSEIMDELVEYIKLDSNTNHETFKGAIYCLLGPPRTRILNKPNWLTVEKLWLNILKSKPSEKPSIVHLMDAIMCYISGEFPTLTIELEIPDKYVEIGLDLVKQTGGSNTITAKDIAMGKQRLASQNKINLERYLHITEEILQIADSTSLHWRYGLMASKMIDVLMHPKTKYPPNVAKYAVQNLINHSIKERKIANRILNTILEQQKLIHVKIRADPFEIAGVPKPEGKLPFGVRDDNFWMQYRLESLPHSQEDWDKPHFLHKTDGFFGWSSNFEVYAPTSEQPSVDRRKDEMNEIENIVYEFFIVKENVDKFVAFWSLEENKGKEKFKQIRFSLIKLLFKLFGDAFFDNFHGHLERLIRDNKIESNHRCAAEILSGIMRGMKHWSFEKTKKMYEKLQPLIRLALDNITIETDEFWGTCFATASEHIDPKRQHWLHEVLIEDPLRESSSFVDCCRIFCLQGPFNQHVWRMDEFAHRLLNYLRPFLNHSFQNVRIRLASLLINICEADLTFVNAKAPQCPRIKDILKEVVATCQPLYNDPPAVRTAGEKGDGQRESPEEKKYEEAARLFKTVAQWIVGVISRNTNGNEREYFDLLPFACRLESCEQDAELADTSLTLLAMISQALTLPDRMDYGLNKIDEISLSPSWGARLAVIDALQVLIFHNMAIVLSREEWVQTVLKIVLRLLQDTVLEVREKASQVLGGLLHCSFLPATDKLLEQFKRKCKTKVLKNKRARRAVLDVIKMEIGNGDGGYEDGEPLTEVDAVRMRHSGVLGLCAFISAYPYDIPEFVPGVFEHLGAHLNDPQPIPSTIRKTIGDFKRTHHDNWAAHQLKFTEDQLAVLSDLTIPPSYYT